MRCFQPLKESLYKITSLARWSNYSLSIASRDWPIECIDFERKGAFEHNSGRVTQSRWSGGSERCRWCGRGQRTQAKAWHTNHCHHTLGFIYCTFWCTIMFIWCFSSDYFFSSDYGAQICFFIPLFKHVHSPTFCSGRHTNVAVPTII